MKSHYPKALLTPEKWEAVKSVFGQLIELPPTDRQAALTKHFSPDSDEFRETQTLLAAHQASPEFLEKPPTLLEEFVVHTLDSWNALQSGEVVEDFEIERSLGEGSFGKVYLAHQRSLNRKVALKVTPDLGEEARTLARLEHEHIVPVYAVQHLANRGLRLTVMKWIQGPDLQSILERLPARWNGPQFLQVLDDLCTQPVTWFPHALSNRERIRRMDQTEVALWLAGCVGKALAQAHEAGILHLDIKPANVLITPFGHPLLTDFNVALDQSCSERPSLFGGTREYMPPEQAALFASAKRDTSQLTVRTDIYALGKLLERMLPTESPLKIEAFIHPHPEKRLPNADALVRMLQFWAQRQRLYKSLPRIPRIWKHLRRHPIWALTAVSVLPQLFGSLINITYNATRVASQLNESQQDVFQTLIPLYNGIVYPILTACFFVIVFPLVRFLRQPQSVETLSGDETRRLRQQFHRFPTRLAVLITLGWLPGALFFPISIDKLAGPIEATVYVHFACSFVLSWLVALSYSYLGTQFFIFRVIYPSLWNPQSLFSENKSHELPQPHRFFHYSAGILPLFAVVLLLAFTQPAEIGNHLSEFRTLLICLTLLGSSGLLFSFQNQSEMQKIHSAFQKLSTHP